MTLLATPLMTGVILFVLLFGMSILGPGLFWGGTRVLKAEGGPTDTSGNERPRRRANGSGHGQPLGSD